MALRIKSSVDLKELEKYGFNKKYYVDEWAYSKELIIGSHYTEEIIVWVKDREIQVAHSIRVLNTLYDLIKADLVEKID